MSTQLYNVTVFWREVPGTPDAPPERATNYGYCYQPQLAQGGHAVFLEHAQSGRLHFINLNATQSINATPVPEKV